MAFSWNDFGDQITFVQMFMGNKDCEGERKPTVFILVNIVKNLLFQIRLVYFKGN